MKDFPLAGGARLAALSVLAALACQAPKYQPYTSPAGDFECEAPWRWSATVAGGTPYFESVTWSGPFDPAFYEGRPLLIARWYAYGRSHLLPDGLGERYASAADYIQQTLSGVYGPRYVLDQPVTDVKLALTGFVAQEFVVSSPMTPRSGARWGVSVSRQDGSTVVWRRHAYVLLPMKRGFYVLIYPATVQGYDLDRSRFDEMVNTFVPLREGPGGPPISYGGEGPWSGGVHH
jgi:hypothetical protein